VTDYNAAIIDEFRAHEGKVGGQLEGSPMLLLHTIGARSGEERVNPLVYQADGERLVVFGSKDGAPTNPDWYHNVLATPDVVVEVGTETVPMRAGVASPVEHERLWARQKELLPRFADYERRAGGRQIPVIVLERRTDS
jgi:deazaflavin-dependent oxidoreductase (nitroreductase family)